LRITLALSPRKGYEFFILEVLIEAIGYR
jgi:hypothetical protein